MNQANNQVTQRLNLVTFIDPDVVYLFCHLDQNIQKDVIKKCIYQAQTTNIKEALGDTLYQELMDEWILSSFNPANIRDNTMTANGVNYKELYDKIVQPLAWWAFVEVLNDVSVQVTSKGLTRLSSDNSEALAYDESLKYIQAQRKRAERNQEDLICYISKTFPKAEGASQKDGYYQSIYFPHRVKSHCKTCKTNCQCH